MSSPFRVNGPSQPPAQGAVVVQAGPDVVVAAEPQRPPVIDSYWQRFMKLIPTEVVAIYPAVVNMIPPAHIPVLFAWAGMGLVFVALSRGILTIDREAGKGPQWPTIIISCVTYVIWIFTLGGPLMDFLFTKAVYDDYSYIGTIVVISWTFIIPFFYTGD